MLTAQLCSGQVYYALLQERDNRKITDIAISRLEQVAPVPYDLLTPHLDTYPNADLIWAQEEPQNVRTAGMGAAAD